MQPVGKGGGTGQFGILAPCLTPAAPRTPLQAGFRSRPCRVLRAPLLSSQQRLARVVSSLRHKMLACPSCSAASLVAPSRVPDV